MEKNIEDLFKASGISLIDFFKYKGGVSGFRIPIYQRKYSWDESHIDRLFDDINEGIQSIKFDEGALTFVGTVILSEEKDLREFEGVSLSVVDGQQRLTTLTLATVELHRKIRKLLIDLEGITSPLIDEFKSKISNRLLNNLMVCFVGKTNPIGNEIADFFPKLIREEPDTWSNKPGNYEYRSPAAKYVYNYLRGVLGDSYSCVPVAGTDQETKFFERNLARVKECVAGDKYFNNSESQLSPIEFIIQKNYRTALFPGFEYESNNIKKEVSTLSENAVIFERLVYFSGLANYLLERVAVTRVIATEEKYAFEIFEALNTTGEPLTALETFKPIVSRYEEENSDGGFIRSESKLIFDRLDSYLDKFKDSDKRQKESAGLVVSLALLIDGRKESLHLNKQRKYLRSLYEDIDTHKRKVECVNQIHHLINFKERFWDKENLETQLVGEKDREFLLFLLDFIREMNTTLTIPILARYHAKDGVSGHNEFAEAIKATAAFLALWRGFYGGTSQIDRFFRDIMQKGSLLPNSTPLRTTRNFSSQPIESGRLKQYYKSFLSKKEMSSKDLWVSGLEKQPIYNKSKHLCRFLLLIASHNSVFDKQTGLLSKGKNDSHKNYMSLMQWRSQNYATVEHIAPYNKPMTGWDEGLYSEAYLIDSIGNLTLLPEKENSSVGNSPWEKKKLFYRAFSTETNDELSLAISEAKKQGLDFGKKTQKLLNEGSCLPVVSSVALTERWGADVIKARSKNIAELSWHELSAWLDL